MRNKADDRQVGGGHYKNGGLEHWTFCSGSSIGYLEGCASKYLIRWRDKAGIQDLEKSDHFLEKLIEMVEVGAIPRNNARILPKLIKKFYEDAKIPYPESLIVDTLFRWKHAGDLKNAQKVLRDFIDEQKCGPNAAYVNQ
jgi:hypothetical protein